MRFFVPLSQDANHGEHLYETIRNRLKETKESPAERRIYVLKFQEEGKRRTVAVGDELHRFVDGPVSPSWRVAPLRRITFVRRNMEHSRASLM